MIGEVATLAGISVRTLRHYDAIGLLSPAGRGDNGYRRYDHDDLERLQRILSYRAVGLDLASIATLLDHDDDRPSLAAHLDAIDRRIAHLAAIRRTLVTTLEARNMGIDLTPEEMLDVFGDHDPTRHADEAGERWGDTAAWATSRRRTRRYGKDDWLRMRAELDAIETALARALDEGAPAAGATARALAEAHRRHIDRWFYPCSSEIHVGLAVMYVSDDRFRDHYDRRRPGLAAYLADAIHANADVSNADAMNADATNEGPANRS